MVVPGTDGADPVYLEGKIDRIDRGPHALLRFKLATRDIAVRALAAASPVNVHLHPDGIHLMPPEG